MICTVQETAKDVPAPLSGGNSCCWKKASVLNSPSPLISCLSSQVRYLVHYTHCRLSDRVCRFQFPCVADCIQMCNGVYSYKERVYKFSRISHFCLLLWSIFYGDSLVRTKFLFLRPRNSVLFLSSIFNLTVQQQTEWKKK
jgi:hypothetical protein